MKQYILRSFGVFFILALSVLGTVGHAYAHVVVKPAQVGVAAFQTFDVGVPTEKDIPTVKIRLLIPQGLKNITPNVKPGWNIEIKRTSEDKNSQISEIIWVGGSIPGGQRDDFYFSAQVPNRETVLEWKTYQTFEDGSVSEWIHQAGNSDEGADLLPFSTTTVVNDLPPASDPQTTIPAPSNNLSLLLSFAAIAIAAASFVATRKKK